jgi:putative holliday junction resolvase
VAQKYAGQEAICVRVLGLDIGSKRIGVAVSDELGITAQPLETLVSKGTEADLERIAALVDRFEAEEIVVGIPFNMNGTEGPEAKKVRAIAERISARVQIPVREWDERLSTVAAERMLLEADVSRSKRRKVIDKLAAVIILQAYLDGRGRRMFSGS